MLTIRLPGEIEARLAELAAKTGRTKTFYAMEAIIKHLDEIENKYLAINRLGNPGKRKSRNTGSAPPYRHSFSAQAFNQNPKPKHLLQPPINLIKLPALASPS